MQPLDLAVIGNCAVAALIAPNARHEWFCFPRLDAEPVFNALLGGIEPERGFMDIVLRDLASTRQRYLRNTAVVETLLTDAAGGVVRVLDLAPRFRRFGRMYRPPMLIRRIEPVAGRPRIAVRVRPSFDHGAEPGRHSIGSNHIRYFGADTVLRLTTDAPLTYIAHEAEFALDRPVTLVLGADESLPESPDTVARNAIAETEAYWLEWVRGLNLPFDWQEAVIRAAITLKLCSFEDTGGIVAALTTSIPEAPGSGRCWDCLLHRGRAEPVERHAHHGRLPALHHGCRAGWIQRPNPAAVPDRARHRGGGAHRHRIARLPRRRSGAHRQCRRDADPE